MQQVTFTYIILIGIIVIQSIYIYLLLQKKKQAKLAESIPQTPEEKYRDLFENANDAIFILDNEHNYIEVNQKAVELFGYSRDEFLQLNVKDVIPSEQISESDKEFEKLRENGKYEKFIGKMRTKDGRWLDIEVNSSIIMSNGTISGSRDIVRDITERKLAEKERESLIAELQKALEEIKSLEGILPLCSFCKKIRDDQGDWKPVDVYIHNHTEADISHSVCPECMKTHYPDFSEKK